MPSGKNGPRAAWPATLMATMLFLAAPAGAEDDHVPPAEKYLLPANSPISADVAAAAYRWLDAVGHRDVEGVTAFAFPEDADYMRAALSDPNRVLHWYFLADDADAYRMAHVPDRGVILLIPAPEYAPPFIVTACFHDRSRHNPTTDAERRQLARFPQPEGVYCEGFVFADGGWRFTYASIEEMYEAPGVPVQGDPYEGL